MSAPAAVAMLALACASCVGGPAEQRYCSGGDPLRERYGTDCLCCHEELGVAGSVDVDGPPIARVVVTDARGRRAIMAPNPYGNFFRHVRLEPPLEVLVEAVDGRVLEMQSKSPHGSCNGCHRPEGPAWPIAGPR